MAKKAGFQQESFTFRIFALIFIHPAGIPQLSTVNFQLSTKFQFAKKERPLRCCERTIPSSTRWCDDYTRLAHALAGGPAALRAEITPGQLQSLVAAGGYFMEQ